MKTLILFFTTLITFNIDAQQRGFTPTNAKGETEKRLALVIGNANYQGNVLTNPLNDAKAMRTALQELGFTVQYYENLNKTAMEAALMRFSTDLHKYNVGLFYFAGHGFESKDKVNYLMSTDMNSSVNEALAKDKSLNLDVVMQSMQDANANSNLLVIDACRNNPFRSWSRDGAKGLGSVSPALGTVVFFAASAGQSADDNRGGKNGLFTEEFLSQIRKPNVELSEILKNTSRAVYKRTGGQMPAISGNLLEDFYFLKGNGEVKSEPKILNEEKKVASEPTAFTEEELLNNGKIAFQTKNYKESLSFFEKASIFNNAESMNYLGIIYEKGFDVVSNSKTAIAWYEASATLGNMDAKNNLKRIKNNISESTNEIKRLNFKRMIHDFGEIDEGVKAVYTFEFTNNSTQNITLKDVASYCNCIVVDWSHYVMIGESGFIKVTFNSTGRPGNFNRNLSVITDTKEQIILTIKGKVI